MTERLDRSPWRDAKLLLALGVLIALAYSNSFGAGLVIDNRILILNDPRLRSASLENIQLILTKEAWWPTGSTGVYRPLATLSYLFNYSVLGGGQSPVGYHVVNLLLQWLNASLAFFLFVRLLGNRLAAFAAAALFAVHPLGTEAVTNVIGRTDQLVAASLLGALLCYVRSGEAYGRRRVSWLVGTGAGAAVGLFSKETAVVVAPLLLLYDVTFRRERLREFWKPLLALLPAYGFFFASRWLVFRHTAPAQFPFTDNPLLGADFLTARLTALRVLARYFGLALWPAKLSSDYSYDQIPVVASGWATGIAVIFLAVGIAIAVLAWRHNKALFFLLGLALAPLIPASNLFIRIQSIMGERFAYTSILGICGCAVLALQRWAPRALPVVAGIAVLAGGVRTYARNADWRDDLTIWASAVHTSPNSAKAHKAYAGALHAADRDRSKLDVVIAEMEVARQILERHPLPLERQDYSVYADVGFYNLEAAERLRNDPSAIARAADHYRRALGALERAHEIESAAIRALQAEAGRTGRPVDGIGDPHVDENLGLAALRLGSFDKALAAYSHLVARSPENPKGHRGVGLAKIGLGRDEEGAISLLAALLVSKWDPDVLVDAIRIYATRFSGSDAIVTKGSETNLNPASSLVHRHLCQAFRQLVSAFGAAGQQEAARQIAHAAATRSCE
jgi:tetratricopeptide (TPR) repeat protein